MLSRSNERPNIFTFTEYIDPENKEMNAQIKKLAEFNWKILFEVATTSALYLQDKHSTQGQGKITEIKETGQGYSIKMLDGTE